MPTLALAALAAILKNEAETLPALLASVAGVVDVLTAVVDESSSDETRAILDAAGAIVRVHPFDDYSSQRNRALELAEEHATWPLMMSGGETLHGADGLRADLETATEPALNLRIHHGSLRFDHPRLSRAGAGWRYRGRTHEVMVGPSSPSGCPARCAPGWIEHRWTAADAARKPDRWRRDVELLAPDAEGGEPRAMFYLAQSFQCLGMVPQAIHWYERRLAAGGNVHETWEAAFRRATLLTGDAHRLALLNCFEVAPHRAEPLFHLSLDCHRAGEYVQASLFAEVGTRIPPPSAGLFVDAEVYGWRIHDALAQAAWHVGDVARGRRAAELALSGYLGAHPMGGPELARLQDHLVWYIARSAGSAPQRVPCPVSEDAAGHSGTREQWAVVIAREDIHGHCFDEVAETLCAGLTELGHDAIIARGIPPMGRRPIVLIANALPADYELAADAIVYNFEQAGSAWLSDPRFIDRCRHASEVWDYSAANVEWWRSHGIRARLVPVGYTPSLSRGWARVEQDVDVLFVGSMNERRSRILDGLTAAGLRVKHLFGVYGAERDCWIARSKVCLNLHFYDAAIFEVARCSYLFANRRAVVSETSVDVGPFADAACFVAYDRIVETCARLVRDDAAREEIATWGEAIMRSLPIVEILRPVVGQGPPFAPAMVPAFTVGPVHRTPIAQIAGTWGGKVCAIAGRGASLAHLRAAHLDGVGGIITFYGAAAVVRALDLRIPHLAMWKDSHSYTITADDGTRRNIGVETKYLTDPTLAPVADSCEEDPAGCEVIGHHEALPLGPTERLLLHLPESVNQFAAHPAIVFDNESMGLRWSMPSVCSAIYIARIMGAASLRMVAFDAYTTGSTEARGGGSDDTYRYQRVAINEALAANGYTDAVEWVTPAPL